MSAFIYIDWMRRTFPIVAFFATDKRWNLSKNL